MTTTHDKDAVERGRDIPNVWGQNLDAHQSLGPRLRAITWPVQGQSTAPDNLFDWLLADNRYPQHRGRSAALHFISEQANEIAALTHQATEQVSDDAVVERVAKAIIAELRRYCTTDQGKCYAYADDGPAPDGGYLAEVDGEFSTWTLARAALAAMPTASTQPDAAVIGELAKITSTVAFGNLADCVAGLRKIEPGMFAYEALVALLANIPKGTDSEQG